MNQARTEFIGKLQDYFDNLPISVSGKKLCVCLSGGADSVSLLLGLLDISQQYEFYVCACHFNHMIRGEEADRDEDFCKSLCDKLNVELYCGRDNVPLFAKTNKMSMEEAARERRYAFFSRIYSKDSIDYCVTAHNMSDDAETLLLNLIRGSGSNGASSISAHSSNMLRPLLKVARFEIEEYLEFVGQEYITDSTNFSNKYTRNFLRNSIFPELKKINPLVIEALTRYTESCRTDRDYFESIVLNSMNSDLRTEHKAVRSRVILRKCKDTTGIIPNNRQISEIDAAVFNEVRTIIPISNGFEAIVDNGNVDFYEKADNSLKVYDPLILRNGSNKIFDDGVEVVISNNTNDFKNFNNLSTKVFLLSDKIVGDLHVRNRRIGDKIYINGVNKKLKKLFIDKKVPKEYRDIIPIISDELGIIYVPFVGISDRVFPKNKKGDLHIRIEFNGIDCERWTSAYEK